MSKSAKAMLFCLSVLSFAATASASSQAGDYYNDVTLKGNDYLTNVLFGRGACLAGYKADSEGRGVESVFLGYDRKPEKSDDKCYDQGVAEARQILAGTDEMSCRNDFNAGRIAGISGFPGTGSFCYRAGIAAGTADLDVGAREGDSGAVGQTCVNEYNRGKADKARLSPGSVSADAVSAKCYNLGYQEN